VKVRAAVTLRKPRVNGGGALLRGRAWPATGRRHARLVVQATAAGTSRSTEVRRLRLRKGGTHYRLVAPLGPGRWKVRVRYVDRGVVEAGRSAARAVTVG
jgi:hypothetical protein